MITKLQHLPFLHTGPAANTWESQTDRPSRNFIGSEPPQLTHVTLIPLLPNPTSHFQPLDQRIVNVFKAAYKQKYAEHYGTHVSFDGKPPVKSTSSKRSI